MNIGGGGDGGFGGGDKVQNIYFSLCVCEGGGGRGKGEGKLFANCKLIGPTAPNQCRIITFFTLKTDNIVKLRIE